MVATLTLMLFQFETFITELYSFYNSICNFLALKFQFLNCAISIYNSTAVKTFLISQLIFCFKSQKHVLTKNISIRSVHPSESVTIAVFQEEKGESQLDEKGNVFNTLSMSDNIYSPICPLSLSWLPIRSVALMAILVLHASNNNFIASYKLTSHEVSIWQQRRIGWLLLIEPLLRFVFGGILNFNTFLIKFNIELSTALQHVR